MFKRLLRSALAVSLILACVSAPVRAETPGNLDPHKREIRNYINSGEYARSVADIALSANKYLLKRIAKGAKKGQKLAIVFDIDETTLTNLSHLLANDFGYNPRIWDAWVAEGRAPAIVPVQTIYDTAVRGKIDIFFITGRNENFQTATEKNLREVGYDTWTKIFYKPAAESMMSTRGFKIDTRRKLTRDGYEIIANVGDQDSDLVGGYAERTFKLPNPFYITN